MKIYGDTNSGNCLKVRYTADVLSIPYEWIAVDIMTRESRTPDFLALSSMGQVPVIKLDDGRTLAQSNAIIRYLARGTPLLPDDHFVQAKIDELLFWEQYSHEPYVAVCRFHMVYLGRARTELEQKLVDRGNAALDWMEKRIAGSDWLVGSAISIADIALIAYTRLAHEGGFDMTNRPNVQNWIKRCEAVLGL